MDRQTSLPTLPTKPAPAENPLKMLDCDVPAISKDGDPFGKSCTEGWGGKVPTASFALLCTPICRLGHAPQPATLPCENVSTHSKRCARRSVRRVASHFVSVYRRALQPVLSWARQSKNGPFAAGNANQICKAL